MPHSPQRLYTASKSGLLCTTPRKHSTTGTIGLTLSGWLGPGQHCSAAANWQRGRHAERWRPRQALPNPRQLPQNAARCANHTASAFAEQSGLDSSCKTLGTTAACSPTWRQLMSPAGWNVPTVTSTRGPHSILANTPLKLVHPLSNPATSLPPPRLRDALPLASAAAGVVGRAAGQPRPRPDRRGRCGLHLCVWVRQCRWVAPTAACRSDKLPSVVALSRAVACQITAVLGRYMSMPGAAADQPFPHRPLPPSRRRRRCRCRAAVAYSDVSQSKSTNSQGGVTKSRTATCLCANGTRIVVTAVFDSAGGYVGPVSTVQRACAPAACRRAGVVGGSLRGRASSAGSVGV